MQLRRLWLTDFRSYVTADVEFAPGLTVITGSNGEGKTNLIEAVGYLATLGSFRGAPNEALVRHGASEAVVRAEGRREDRELLIEAAIAPAGRGKVLVNRQRLPRSRDLLGALRVSVFSPDDLVLVKGGPGERRRYLDDTLVALHTPYDALRSDLDKVLRQRNALLRQAGGRLTPDIEATLDVWDAKLAATGTEVGRRRVDLVAQLAPVLAGSYELLADRPATVALAYEAPWMAEGLGVALDEARTNELRRGVSLVGPHRDELAITLDGLPARTHASQGEQRTLALALRLAAHLLVTETVGTAPVLLLDDVFSELDPDRSAALLAHLPAGQTILTSAAGYPAGAEPESVLEVRDGQVTPR